MICFRLLSVIPRASHMKLKSRLFNNSYPERASHMKLKSRLFNNSYPESPDRPFQFSTYGRKPPYEILSMPTPLTFRQSGSDLPFGNPSNLSNFHALGFRVALYKFEDNHCIL